MLKQRLLTAAVLIPLTVVILFFASPMLFCFITAAVVLAAGWEWANLIKLKLMRSKIAYLASCFLFMLAALYVRVQLILLLATVWWLLALVLVLCYPRGRQICWHFLFARMLSGWLILIPCWVAINYIFNQVYGFENLLFLFLLVFGADSCAYFAGKRFGRRKLLPTVSPGKSVQGVVAAFIYAIGLTSFVTWYLHIPHQFFLFCNLVAIITVLFSIVGDLTESMFKRQADLKDSSGILPGHGGILDRIDSLTAAAPVYVVSMLILGQYAASLN